MEIGILKWLQYMFAQICILLKNKVCFPQLKFRDTMEVMERK